MNPWREATLVFITMISIVVIAVAAIYGFVALLAAIGVWSLVLLVPPVCFLIIWLIKLDIERNG